MNSLLCIFLVFDICMHQTKQTTFWHAVDMQLDSHNLNVICTFLDSFQGDAYCEIKLIDSAFTQLEIRE